MPQEIFRYTYGGSRFTCIYSTRPPEEYPCLVSSFKPFLLPVLFCGASPSLTLSTSTPSLFLSIICFVALRTPAAGLESTQSCFSWALQHTHLFRFFFIVLYLLFKMCVWRYVCLSPVSIHLWCRTTTSSVPPSLITLILHPMSLPLYTITESNVIMPYLL